MSGFVHRVKPIWRDMDALQHVNNAVYLTYLENAREAWWQDLAGNFGIFPFTLARIEIDYRNSATWKDEIAVKVAVTRIGTTSFDLTYELDAADGRRLADAKSVLVMMEEGHTAPLKIDDSLRKKMKAYERPSA
ncbi:MAG: acyl-CoA thioesterase [Planctomycetes bacterium]|nr:acyl-CoA thioesterase [Planctomycetota bacterium]